MMDHKQDLGRLRAEIEAIDRKLLDLFDQRMQLASQVAETKKTSGRPVFDARREDDLVLAVTSQVAPEHRQRAANLLRCLMRLSRGVQYELLLDSEKAAAWHTLTGRSPDAYPHLTQVVCQGAEGSYSVYAGQALFPGSPIRQTRTFDQACRQVSADQADVAVLPLENSTAGTVDDVYDLLLRYDLHIWRSLAMPIRHLLLAAPGTRRQDIHTVISHPQAIAQCSEVISREGWQVQESLNTAFAAKTVAEGRTPGMAAIASQVAADTYQLAVLDTAISNSQLNQTRFIAIGNKPLITADANRVSLILRLPHSSGALAATLAVFSDRSLNLAKIQSRPDPQQPWSYLFYLDFEAKWQDRAAVAATLFHLSEEMPYLRFLGWYREMQLD